MDEGTAHLDVATERMVNQSVASLGITRIIIAHRPETIRSADRVMEMQAGVLAEVDMTEQVHLAGDPTGGELEKSPEKSSEKSLKKSLAKNEIPPTEQRTAGIASPF